MRKLRVQRALLLAAVCLVLTLSVRELDRATVAAADERETLLQADRDFDKVTAEKGVDGWVSFLAEDGLMFPAGGEIVSGRAAIREAMASAFQTPGFSLRWKPVGAEVSQSADLGYTFGTSVVKTTDPKGRPIERHGKYVTIWKKQADGTWKVALDIGNASPPPPPSRGKTLS
jgi:ketosteroid isomerase-like protein